MNLEERLRVIADCLPAGARLMLTKESILDLLAGNRPGKIRPSSPAPDLTVQDVARRYERSPSTIRGWIREGRLGAYRLGREYRIELCSLAEFESHARQNSNDELQRVAKGAGFDIAAWRRFVDPEVDQN